ncbi:MAG: uncharacterized membrane protein YebE (DUF533 family) [Gammaproteobacteria bacterium]|jgi:uncharacterized membrane protein YebE (DUF533 family)
MNIQNMLSQFLGQSDQAPQTGNGSQSFANSAGSITSKIPGGLMGGAAAGGVIALLVGNQSARKFAGKAATYGGAAVLGGLAFKAYKNWQQNNMVAVDVNCVGQGSPIPPQQAFAVPQQPASFDLSIVKAMIAAAKADGHIDAEEQRRIFKAVDKMELSSDVKATLFDLLSQDIAVEEIASGASGLEQRTELYLASCLVINPDHPSEKVHLEKLALALELPAGLAEHLESQAGQALLTENVQ